VGAYTHTGAHLRHTQARIHTHTHAHTHTRKHPHPLFEHAQVVADYLADPLNTTGNLPARSAVQMLAAFKYLVPRYSKFELPIYAAHGTMVGGGWRGGGVRGVG